ncbi:MAG: methyltransferase [Chitinophagales bacterium]
MKNNLPLKVIINQMIFGCVITQAIHVAAKLNIADLLAVHGPMDCSALAKASGAHEESLYRLMRALASAGIFSVGENGKFSMTPLAEHLRADNPESSKAMAIAIGNVFYKAYDELLYSVQTGDGGFKKAFDVPVFEYLSNHPEDGRTFDRMMTDIHGGETEPMVNTYDFSAFTTIVDVGGGNGEVISAVLNKNPGAKGILFDLPDVIERSRDKIMARAMGDRCKIVPGNFFESVPKADAYILRHIVHDWSDDDTVTILSNCRKSMNPGGKVLVVEAAIQPGNEPSPFKMLDLSMLLVGGKERTREQFQKVFANAGLKLNRVVPFQEDLSVVEGVAG